MRILKFRKASGCILEVVVFDNGKTVACWQTKVPEVAVYDNLEQFLSVRTKERGYEIIDDKMIDDKTWEGWLKTPDGQKRVRQFMRLEKERATK